MIRRMTEDDLEQIMLLEEELFSSPWTEEAYLYELNENAYSRLYVIEIDNEIVAYAGLWVLFDQAQVTTIGVSKKQQSKGYGAKMLEHLIKEAQNSEAEVISLEVRVSNEKAIKLYEKYEFEKINIRKSYYQDNHEDAYAMMRGI